MDSMAFNPIWAAGTVNIAVTNGSQTVSLAAGAFNQVRVVNNTNQTVFINFGGSGVTASTTTSAPMLAGTVEVFTIDNSVTTAAAIGTATNGNIYFTRGYGL